MPPTMIWLATVTRVAIAPVVVGALVLLVESPRSASDLAAAVGLLLLGAMHVVYWWQPWPSRQGRAAGAVVGMVMANFVLLNLLGLTQPLLWLYPALVAGAGLRVPVAIAGVGLTALAAAAPIALAGGVVHPVQPAEHSDRATPCCCRSCSPALA